MSKIIISELNYSYKEYYRPIFSNVNLSLDTEWKLGLIGRNGRGKTTLLRLLHGELEPDRGVIVKEAKTELFPYQVKATYTNTLDVIKENISGLKSMEERMEQIVTDGKEEELEEYQKLLSEYMEQDGFAMESRIRKELFLMNLPENLLEQEYELLSGGEKTKMQIITLFLRKNTFVLLDEPTNHLDLEGKQLLAGYLKNKKGFLIVSHDRSFLDEVIDHVLSINKSNIALEKGNFSSWKHNKEMYEEYEMRTKARLEREVEALEKVSVRSRTWGAAAEKEKNPFATHNRGNGTRAAKFMRQAKHAELNIHNNLEEKKKLLKNYEVTSKLIIASEDTGSATLISAYHLSFGYSEELLINNLSFQIAKGDRIWIKGRNGAGKSTLLKIIDRRIPQEGLHYSEHVNIQTAYQEPLWITGYIDEFIPDTDTRNRFYDICHRLDLTYEVLRQPLQTLSSGELKKIDIARALTMPGQVLLLDEPLNFMDIYFREQLEDAILTYQPTIVFVEHDEQFGNKVATAVIEL